MEAKTIDLPILDDLKPVSPEQVSEFQRNGHIITYDLLSKEEVRAFQKVISKAADEFNQEKRQLSERDTYGKAFLQIMNLWRVNEQVKRFVLAKRFAGIAASLLGVDNVRLYHDQALFKEPGGGPTPWHQDQNYWPLDTKNTITMWMPMVDIPHPDMGMLTFASGSHLQGNVFDYVISDESEDAFEQYVREKRFPLVKPSAMKAGDATWHNGFTIHHAPGNNSTDMREVMTIIYYADGARITTPQHAYQENDLKQWLGSKEPGTLADSEMNPLLL
ncbi:phytanoyl-CoA dioxygenase family protein [Olivibacter sp. SDN3]|uniref:phytanoyl-CoA dioxygenase family protein n=1 Tax=Olivibacter sp. SDN3 TaxID=2764720 RepID=UPI001650FC13|nr:phytanoyl-CoA dioxygenase family protein [Olivibacter sp. SDN3]QNL48310.1 phytanoyl-CoA dioxygenase family protein [Olivibacter sp. SDN3]